MAIPLLDWSIKSVIDYTMKVVQSNPDKYVREIFGDARTEPFAVVYGDHFITQVVNWVKVTKVPVVLGFDIDPANMPGVSVHLEKSMPAQAFLADTSFISHEPIEPYNREVLVPKFSAKNLTLSQDSKYYLVEMPDLDPRSLNLVIPGLIWRDANGNEFGIGDHQGSPTIFSMNTPLDKGNFSSLEVISPICEASYRDGAMLYEETALIAIHGHSDRSEGIWLWAIVQWGLLKFRPLLISTYGLDLGMPMASDFVKDDSFMGENIWRRFITLSTKAVWSWQGPRRQDVVAFLLNLRAEANGEIAVLDK
jgi:hypothetical protein